MKRISVLAARVWGVGDKDVRQTRGLKLKGRGPGPPPILDWCNDVTHQFSGLLAAQVFLEVTANVVLPPSKPIVTDRVRPGSEIH